MQMQLARGRVAGALLADPRPHPGLL
jgi:hypothetical protein